MVRGELSWRSCGCIRVPVPRNAQKLQSKQTNTSPTPKPMFSCLPLSLSCSCPEFMLICTCLCPVSGTCGRACPGERAGTCFAVCFWQDKHKAQDKERERRREREQCVRFVCGNVARKTIAKSSFARHVAGECLPREILLMCLHTHTRTYIHTHTGADRSSHAALKMQKPKSKNKAKSNAFAINSQQVCSACFSL